MKSASPALIALLAGSQQFAMADCYTLTLADGVTVYRFTSFDIDLAFGGTTWPSGGPIIERDKTRTVIGLEVDTLTLKISPKDSDQLGALSWFGMACSGGLDGASLTLQRAFLDPATLQAGAPTVTGLLTMFVGKVAQLAVDRQTIDMTVNSPLQQLNIQMPRNLYQSGCQHTLFDTGCTLSAATYAKTGSVTGSPTATSVPALITGSPGAGWCDLGVIQFTSGVLTGLKRTVKSWDGSAITLLNPAPAAPHSGDSFTVGPGCDKTTATCTARFGNLLNFKGFPYIPVPETAL